MVELLQSQLELNPQKHVIFRQLIRNNQGEEPQWLDMNMSDPNIPDEHGLTAEEAILLGVALPKGITTDEIRQRLENGEIIYLVPPKGETPKQVP